MGMFEIDCGALDRYITGNYGEDQFRGEHELERAYDLTCGQCRVQKDPETCGWNPDFGWGEWESCPLVALMIRERDEEQARYDADMELFYMNNNEG
jgi:hypothetical protein